MSIFKKKKPNLLVDIRRNDYLASITASISDAKSQVAECGHLEKQATDLINYCSENHLHKMKKVAKIELKLAKKRHKFFTQMQADLVDLYEKAYKYIPGSR